MNSLRSRVTAAVLFALPPALSAQTAASNPAPASKSADTLVQLNPFEVQADSDKSYGALNSNSITGFNAQLEKLPLSADIYDQAFMNDVSASDVESMITTYSAGVGSSATDNGASPASNQPGDRPGGSIQVRGLTVNSIERDGFIASPSTGVGITSNFDLDRVEIIDGPQALLYGAGGAGGVVNTVSKQARFGEGTQGALSYRVDQYGNKRGLLDVNVSTDNVAARVAAIDQFNGGRRLWIGGTLEGQYVQLAANLPLHTTLRLTVEQSTYNRINSANASLAATSTTADARNGDSLHYLLASDQTGAGTLNAAGQANAAGAIDNGLVNWGNVDSYEGWWASELTVDTFAEAIADTQFTPWLSGSLKVGYNTSSDDRVNATFYFYAPGASGNSTGTWAAGLTPADTEEPSRTKAARYTLLATNPLFGGKAVSQTTLGTDFSRTDSGQIAETWYEADSNFNVLVNANSAANLGRTPIGRQVWSIAGGPVAYPVFNPQSKDVTINGVNYVRQVEDPVSPALISPSSPEGSVPGASGDYITTKAMNKGPIFGANYTQWDDSKLDTILGFRLSDDSQYREQQGTGVNTYKFTDSGKLFSYNFGADYQLIPGLRTYAEVSDSYGTPPLQENDPAGVTVKVSHGVGQELGLKWQNPSSTLSGQLSVYHANTRNESYEISSTIASDINPSGLNGTYNNGGQYINIQHTSEGVQLAVTAQPTPGWRLRLSAADVSGTIGATVAYGQYYNDQFNENSAGQVTYADGTPVYVNPTYNSKSPVATSTTAGAVPLTVAMMNNPSSPYYANPAPITAVINAGSDVATVLKTVDPVHGAILTGVAGLPISALQIAPNAAAPPPGTIDAVVAGDNTTGYPRYSLVLTNVYEFGSAWLKGLRVGGTVLSSWQNRDYYYYTSAVSPSVQRDFFDLPQVFRFDGILGYSRKFKRIGWDIQLNVTNVFNRYSIIYLPNENTGYSLTSSVNATFNQQPRAYLLTNTIRF